MFNIKKAIKSMNTSTSSSKKLYWPILLILMLPPLFWAGNFVVGRAVRDDLSPIMLSTARWVIALLCLLPFAWKAVVRDIPRYWQHRWTLLGVSVTGITLFNSLVYIGLHSTTAANGLLMNSFIPVIIVIIGAVFYKQHLSTLQIAGLAISCVGAFTIILNGSIENLMQLQFSQGDLIIFLAVICFALYTLWFKNLPSDLNRLGLLCAQMIVGLIILTPFFAWEYMHGMHNVWSLQSISALFYVGIIASVIAYLLYMYGISQVGPQRAGVFMHLIPVFGAILSVIFLGESLHLYHAFGIAAIFIGLGFTSYQQKTTKVTSVRNHPAHAVLKGH